MSVRGTLGRSSLLIAAAVVAVDQLAKHWAVDALADGRPRHVVGSLQWNLSFNSGMAFSRGQGAGPVIGAVAIVVIAALLVSLHRAGSVVSAIAVGLVIGGAAGNLVDRLFRGDGWLRGSVVDFIDLQWWPIFNVADMAITIGGPLLLLSAYLAARHEHVAGEAQADGTVEVGPSEPGRP
jgi:signal peptidase II